MQKQQYRRRTFREYLGLIPRGFAMGSADVVPGVSGGTMAFILGIYEELIDSIREFGRPSTFRLLFGLEFRRMYDELPWRFLLALLSGILLAIFTLAGFLEWTLENHPTLLWAFFFGLVLASVHTVSRRIRSWKPLLVLLTAAATIAAFFFVGLVPVDTPNDAWFLFVSGVLAICAMILPGISGSFVLVLLGKYQFVLSAVTARDIVPLLWVALGCGVGLMTFAQVLGWFFKRYHDPTVAVLIGLMIGSLRKVWPWKETVQTITGRHGEAIPVIEINVLPDAITSYVLYAVGLAVVGFLVVLALEHWAARHASGSASTASV
jgi:putative membrane protein